MASGDDEFFGRFIKPNVMQMHAEYSIEETQQIFAAIETSRIISAVNQATEELKAVKNPGVACQGPEWLDECCGQCTWCVRLAEILAGKAPLDIEQRRKALTMAKLQLMEAKDRTEKAMLARAAAAGKDEPRDPDVPF